MNLFRATGLLDLDVVMTQKLIVVGLGSLGSLTVSNLAYPWRQIVLIDPDKLEEDNVERHLLSRGDIGKPKVEGVRNWLVGRGVPKKNIVIHKGFAQDVLYKHTDAQLAIITVDNRNAKAFVDGWARQHNTPIIVGGIYAKGTGGHTVVLPSPNDICYACAAHALHEDAYTGSDHSNYGVTISELLDSDGNMHKVPSLRAPISAVAADIAVEALDILKGGDTKAAHILYHAIQWETVLTFGAGSEQVKQVVNYIAYHSIMGLLPHMRLEMDGSKARLMLRRGYLPEKLTRWNACPNHMASTHSLEEI